jgi:hypothetical protein
VSIARMRWFKCCCFRWLNHPFYLLPVLVSLTTALVVDASEKVEKGRSTTTSIAGRAFVLSMAEGQHRWRLPITGSRDTWLVAVSRVHEKKNQGEIILRAALKSNDSRPSATNRILAWRSPVGDAGVIKTGHRVARPAFQPLNKSAQTARKSREFYVQTRSGSSDELSEYEVIKSVLIASGKTVNVYLDSMENAESRQKTAEEIIKIFDHDIPSSVVPRIGRAGDIDGDGKMAVLLTPALSRMADGKMAIDGFVRPSDFDPAGTLPRSHAADVIFINSRVNDSGYLKSLLAHEFTHAVAATVRQLMAAEDETEVEEEESWLEEGLAHLSERWVDGSWANLNYRISAYYESPESNRLIVNDLAGLGSGRSHGHRGATFLFLRWCEETYGSDLPRRLIESRLTGIENLENATGSDFNELFRAWTLKLMGEISGEGSLESVKDRALLDDWLAGTPRETSLTIAFESQELTWNPQATATRFFRMSAEQAVGEESFLELELEGANDEDFQVTAMPLRDRHLGMDLRAVVENSSTETEPASVKIKLLIKNRDPRHRLILQSAAWENQSITTDSEKARAARGQFDILMIARQFGSYKIEPGKTLETPPISIPMNQFSEMDLIHWKIVAHDESGKPIFAQANAKYWEQKPSERIANREEIGTKPVRR